MRVARLTQDLEKRRIGDEEESGKEESFLLEVSRQRLLTQLELLETVREELRERVVASAALHDERVLVRLNNNNKTLFRH